MERRAKQSRQHKWDGIAPRSQLAALAVLSLPAPPLRPTFLTLPSVLSHRSLVSSLPTNATSCSLPIDLHGRRGLAAWSEALLVIRHYRLASAFACWRAHACTIRRQRVGLAALSARRTAALRELARRALHLWCAVTQVEAGRVHALRRAAFGAWALVFSRYSSMLGLRERHARTVRRRTWEGWRALCNRRSVH